MKSGGTVWILILVLLLGCASASASTAEGGIVVFHSNRHGTNWQIYGMHADGTQVVRLTFSARIDSYPRLTLDGSQIVYQSNRHGNWEVYKIDRDGTNETRLTSVSAADRYPAWSPDGEYIVFQSNRDGRWQIYSMLADGSEQTNLSRNSYSDAWPSWSPKGDKIAFSSSRDGSWQIYVMNTDGTEQTRLTFADADHKHAAWSPDGTKIAFTSDRDGGWDIYVMNADGSSVQRLTDSPAEDTYPTWSPDGSMIIFNSDRDGARNVYVMDADGSNQRNLHLTPFADEYPSWASIPQAKPEGDATANADGEGLPDGDIGDGKPVTVTTRIRLLEPDRLDEIVLAAVTAEDDASDIGLSVAFAKEHNLLIGEYWSLKLQDDLSSTLAEPGPSPGSIDISLISALTGLRLHVGSGSLYETVLSFDPRTGVAAVRVTDLLTEHTLVDRGFQLTAYNGKVQPREVPYAASQAGDSAVGSSIVLEHFQVDEVFLPMGIEWQLVEAGEDKASHQVIGYIDRRKQPYLQLGMAWNELKGQLRLVLESDTDSRELATVATPTDGQLVPVSTQNLPAGTYKLVLEHWDEGRARILGERPLSVGVVDVVVEDVDVRFSADSGTVTGFVTVTADGDTSPVRVQLHGEFSKSELDVNHTQGVGRIISQPSTLELLDEEIHELPASGIRLPFRVSFPASSDPGYMPYELWDVRLRPSADAPVQVATSDYDVQLRRRPHALSGDDAIAEASIRVMSYNIRHGLGMDEQIDLQRIADVIAVSGADIIALNEIDVNTQRSGNVDQPRVLAELLGMHAAFGGKYAYQGGEFGNAILSRFPIRSTRNIVVPPGQRPQSVLHAEIDVDGKAVHLLSAHLSLEHDASLAQLLAVMEETESLDGPVIVAGDLNRIADTETDPALILSPVFTDAWRERLRLLGDLTGLERAPGHTFRSSSPVRRIDFIFYKGGLELRDPGGVYVIDSLASDHRPVVATLHFVGEE